MRATETEPGAKSDVYDLFPALYALRRTRANTLFRTTSISWRWLMRW
jgi:ABC-type branched-subunit amino acid transport system ATPase component